MSNDPKPGELTKDHLDFAWKTHDYIHNYIRFSDTKAAFVVTWCTAMIGAMCFAKLHEGTLRGEFKWDLLWSSAGGFLFLALAFLSAVWAMIPRLWTAQLSGLVFWDSIVVHATADLYANSLGRETSSGLARHLCGQTYMVAKIASAKFFWSGLAIWLALLGTACAVAAIALKAAIPLPPP